MVDIFWPHRCRLYDGNRYVPTRILAELESRWGEPIVVSDIEDINAACILVTKQSIHQENIAWEAEHWPDIHPYQEIASEFLGVLENGKRPKDKAQLTVVEQTQALLEIFRNPKFLEALHLPEDIYPPRPQSEEEVAFLRFSQDWHTNPALDSRLYWFR